ncbi:hypothetical protein CBM2589_U10242 [Cupriavidus taiwanensis]|uniref:Uncharacterized protein n=1 Tax=Cupriavidus taiwanensis TaxID=164546 RepID=A0A375CR92_9BURK|nr:hypothetical protein CBM2589_U10242 [Cupriavidus taiwanensis]
MAIVLADTPDFDAGHRTVKLNCASASWETFNGSPIPRLPLVVVRLGVDTRQALYRHRDQFSDPIQPVEQGRLARKATVHLRADPAGGRAGRHDQGL